MIPILYEHGETAFLTNGLGRLTDCISCEVTEERNGIYECQFEYPENGRLYSKIQEGCIIYCTHDDKKDPQPFDIYKRSAPISGVVTFYAHHISYRLGNVILKPFTAGSCSQAFATFGANCLTECPFTFWTDKDVTKTFTVEAPKALKEALGGSAGSILDVYGKGDYQWDKYTVKLYLNRGQDTAVEIRYGKNLLDLQQEVDYTGTYTAVAPFWTREGETVYSDVIATTTVTNTDSLTIETGEALTDEDGNALEAPYTLVKAVPMDLSEKWQEAPTVAQLQQAAAQILDSSNAWVPDENITVNFVALWQTQEYANYAPLQRVSLCDKVKVIYSQLGINVKKEIIKVVYDSLNERYTEMELGDPKTSFAQMVKADTETEILQTVPTQSTLDAAIQHATQLISGGLGGHVVIGTNADGQPNEILVMDTDDITTAVNVIRINAAGIGFSTTGYEGTYRTAWTIDGHFVADFIDSGTMTANVIKGGILTDKLGRNYWNMETGDISISFDPGSGADVTQADLQRVENNAQTWAGEAEANANAYTDGKNFLTEEECDSKITANNAQLDIHYGNTYTAKADAITGQTRWYYQSLSPTELSGGSWSTTPPTWTEGTYIWERIQTIKGNGTSTFSDPVCITGNTGDVEEGARGEDAILLYITSDKATMTPKETPLTVTLTAKIQKAEESDIDPLGTKNYVWYQTRDDSTQEFCGKGKTYTFTIEDGYCEDRASVWFGLADDASFYNLMDESGNVLTDESNNPLEAA